MKSILVDREYQSALDNLADDYVVLSTEQLSEIPDYGSLNINVFGSHRGVGYWNYKFPDNVNHLVFSTSRKIVLFLSRKYVSGIVYGERMDPRLMSLDECAQYDWG